MTTFSPLSGLAGGSLIGLSAGTLLLGNGDILGCSGIISSILLDPRRTIMDSPNRWKVAFLASFLVVSNLFHKYIDQGAAGPTDCITTNSCTSPIVSSMGYTVAGLLVGFGTRLGNGCTSGHGICGLARLSKRSFVAVVTFMSTGILSATICSPECPLARFLRTTDVHAYAQTETSTYVSALLTAFIAGVALPTFLHHYPTKATANHSEEEQKLLEQDSNNIRKRSLAALSGALFSVGLAVSGMIHGYKIYGFLDMKGFRTKTWDGTLAFVMGGGLLISFIGYQYVMGHNVIKHEKTLACPLTQHKGKFSVPTNTVIDTPLVLGASLFGLGWGIGGLCPGPALYNAAIGYPLVLYNWWPAYFVGTYLGEKSKSLFSK